jgi:hypothetical protein
MQVSRNITEICFSLLICLSIVSQYVPIKLYKRYFSKNFKIKYKIQSFHDHLDRERIRGRRREGEFFFG